jgi:hypothetical protein
MAATAAAIDATAITRSNDFMTPPSLDCTKRGAAR